MNVPEGKIVRRRRLVFNAALKVRVGEPVRPDAVVALTMLPLPRLFFLSAFRALPQGSLLGYRAEWVAEPGEEVDIDTPIVQFTRIEQEPGELWAEEPPQHVFRSPLPGTIESINEETGIVLLREKVDYGRRRALVQVGFKVGASGRRLKRYLRRRRGEFVEKGQILAQRIEAGDKGSPGQFAFARAPIAGVITEIDLDRGLVRIEREFKQVEIKAGFFGTVTAIDEEGIEITAQGRRVQGICGIGGEAFGRLKVALKDPGELLDASDISEPHAGYILIGGACIGLEALQKAAEVGIRGVITGGADHLDLCRFLGQDFAVAITGREKAPFPVIITGEFGEMPMDKELFDFFREHEGSWVHVDSTTHMRAGVIRPEIIIMSDQH